MEVRKISDLYWRFSPNLSFLSILLSMVAGTCHSLLIPFIIYATSSSRAGTVGGLGIENYNFFNSPTSEMAKLFLAACLGIICVRFLSRALLAYIAENASMQHRIALYKKINMLPYSDLERIGQSRLINLLDIDVPNFTLAAMSLPIIWINFIVILGTLGYLIYLNVKVFVFVLFCFVVGLAIYQIPVLIGVRYFAKARKRHDIVQQGVLGLIYGAKELKLSGLKSFQYVDEELIAHEQALLNDKFKGLRAVFFGETSGEFICFLIIGLIIFHLPYVYQITQLELFGIVMVLLYLTGPVGSILNATGNLQLGKVALDNMKDFDNLLVEENIQLINRVNFTWDCLRLENVTYQYTGQGDGFALRDISLEFKKGQITFIVGGNGSGKSTLSKIISLHYLPTEGKLLLGDEVISDNNIVFARELISAIYSDFFVFLKLYGEHDPQIVSMYLKRLHLDDKVKIVDQHFNTISLSDGQRKRLALLSLLLDDRPICVFDEWAADQDPYFKAIFYKEILPELKAQGKVVIVITHDDRYFDCCDQIIYMEQGSVRKVEKSEKQADILTSAKRTA